MNKKFYVATDVVKALSEALAPFKSANGVIVFKIGLGTSGDKLNAAAQLTNGGQQICRGFLIEKPKDYEDGLYASFNVRADAYLAYAEKLTGFNADISFEVSDTVLTLSVKGSAKVQIALVADSEVPPALPEEPQVISAMEISGADLSRLLLRGASCGKNEDAEHEVGDRTLFTVGPKTLRVYSSDGAHTFARTDQGELKAAVQPDEAAKAYVRDQAGLLAPKDFEEFKAKAEAAIEAGTVTEFVKEQGGDVDHATFGLSTTQVNVLGQMIKGAKTVQIKESPHYAYVKVGNAMATFALVKIKEMTLKFYHGSIDKMYESEAAATIVVDKAELSRAIEITELSGTLDNGTAKPVHMLLEGDNLLTCDSGDNRANVKVTGNFGDKEAVEVYINTSYLKKALSTLPAGNIKLFFTNSTSPLGVTSGGLDDTVISKFWLMPVRPNVAEADSAETDEKAETKES